MVHSPMKSKRFEDRGRQSALTRFHDLRHTFGTRMAAAGVPRRTLQEWMGHRDFKTTLIHADTCPVSGRPISSTRHSSAAARA